MSVRNLTTRSTRRSSRHGACRASAAPLGPRVTAGVVRTTRTSRVNCLQRAFAESLAGRLCSHGGSARAHPACERSSRPEFQGVLQATAGPAITLCQPSGAAFARPASIAAPASSRVISRGRAGGAGQAPRRGGVATPDRVAPLVATKRSYTCPSQQQPRGHRGWPRGPETNVKGVPYNSSLSPTHFAASRRLHTAASVAPLLVRGLAWR